MAISFLPNAKLDKKASGDFTLFNCVSKLDRDELESRLGFHKGRLDRGAILAVMFKPDLDRLVCMDFIFSASTRWSRSSSAAPWAPEFATFSLNGESRMEDNAIESLLALRGQNIPILKEKALRRMRENFEMLAPAKVFPVWRHEDGMEYPSAEFGVPQFKLLKEVHWVVKRVFSAKV